MMSQSTNLPASTFQTYFSEMKCALFHCLKERRMLDEKHISNILRYVGNDLPQLTDRVQCLTNDVLNLEGKKRNLMNKLILWNAQLSDLGRAIDIKNQQLKRMDK
jgi:hypothetical protein